MALSASSSRLSKAADICSILSLIVAIVIGGFTIYLWSKKGDIPVNWSSIAFGALVVLMLAAAVLQVYAVKVRRSSSPQNSNKENVASVEHGSLRSELDRLNPYQLLAVHQLAARGGMTGEQFTNHLHDWGFPIGSQADEKIIAAVFEIINQKTTLLIRDDQNLWNLRDRQAVATLFR